VYNASNRPSGDNNTTEANSRGERLYIKCAIWRYCKDKNLPQLRFTIDYSLVVKGDDFVIFVTRKMAKLVEEALKYSFAAEMTTEYKSYGFG